jgi:hypothetical protein
MPRSGDVSWGDPVVDILYEYEQTCYPKSGEGAVSGIHASLTATVGVELRRLREADVRTVAMLRIQGSRATLDVVEAEGVTYRAVCRPSSLEPCSLADFADAAMGQLAWRDSPSKPAQPKGGPASAVGAPRPKAEPGTPSPVVVDKYWMRPRRLEQPLRKWGEDSTEAAKRASVVARMADYVVVGDVVYRRCDEPTIRIYLSEEGGGTHLLAGWNFADLDMAISPMEGGFWYEKRKLSQEGMRKMYPLFDGVLGEFRLDRMDDAYAFMCACVKSVYQLGGLEVSRAPCARRVDGCALRGPDDLVGLLDFARKTLRSHGSWRGLADADSVRIRGWADARDALLSEGGISEDVLKRSFDALAAVARSRVEDKVAQDADERMLALRWTSVERRRNLAHALSGQGPSAADAEALAGMAP